MERLCPGSQVLRWKAVKGCVDCIVKQNEDKGPTRENKQYRRADKWLQNDTILIRLMISREPVGSLAKPQMASASLQWSCLQNCAGHSGQNFAWCATVWVQVEHQVNIKRNDCLSPEEDTNFFLCSLGHTQLFSEYQASCTRVF